MLKGEIRILADIALKKPTTKQIITCQIARDNLSILLALATLCHDGYAVKNIDERYHITSKGLNILEELYPLYFSSSEEIYYKVINGKIKQANKSIGMIARLRREYMNTVFSPDKQESGAL